MNRPSILAAAHYFARLGFSFYPTRGRSKEPFSELLPTGTMTNGKVGPVWSPFRAALPDARQIETWFQIAPDANLALITGAVSNLVIIEFDEASGIDAFCELCEIESLSDLQTPLVQSRRGFHVYFAHPGFVVRGQIGDFCEVKGDGLSCTAPPSIHQSGHLYRFERGHAPRDCALQPIPGVILEQIQTNTKPEAPTALRQKYRQLLPDSGSAYGRKALQNACSSLASTREGRHNAIHHTSYAIGRVVGAGALDYPTAFAALEHAATCTGYAPSECARLVRDGLAAGMQSPRVIENRVPIRAGKARPTLAEMRGKGAFA